MLQIKNVSKRYGEQKALNQVSLTIDHGMNFIIGASGSGKTTLLQIMTGMDNEYQGDVYLYGQSIKALNQKEKSSLYHNTFGFIWQDFKLLEDCTVLENILLPSQLDQEVDITYAKKLIHDFKLKKVESALVKTLSGGQKQRVAIARELMKRPQVLVADEPTSALDQKTSREIMGLLRIISIDCIVIVVTHDTSHIQVKDTVFELDKGELITTNESEISSSNQSLQLNKTKLPLRHIMSLIKMNMKHHKGRFLITLLSLVLGVSLLLTTVSNRLGVNSDTAFQELFDQYGDSVLDLQLYHSFSGAAGTGDQSNKKPNVDVNQNISTIYETYKNDTRIEFIAFLEVFDQIKIDYNNQTYHVQGSSEVPAMNKLVAGRMPKGEGKEIVVPKSLVKTMGVTQEELLNKTITFSGAITDWTGNTPSYQNTSLEVTIVGVMDTKMTVNVEGEKFEYEIEDAFLFNQGALTELLSKTSKDHENLNMIMRAKTPKDFIDIKDELNKIGIVPLGNFEVIEDMVRLQSQSTEQSNTGNLLMIGLVLVMMIAISLITSVMRRKEYAIYKINGFSKMNLSCLNAFDAITQLFGGFILMVILSPLLNLISKSIFHITMISIDCIDLCMVLMVALCILNFLVTEIVCETTSILKTFRTGERS